MAKEVVEKPQLWSGKRVSKPWQGYTPDVGVEKARELFEAKFGHKPEEEQIMDSCILLGPVYE